MVSLVRVKALVKALKVNSYEPKYLLVQIITVIHLRLNRMKQEDAKWSECLHNEIDKHKKLEYVLTVIYVSPSNNNSHTVDYSWWSDLSPLFEIYD